MKFKKYLEEVVSSKVADPNYGLGNDDKGKLHEILVGHFLIHGTDHDHPGKAPASSSPKFPQRPAVEGGKKEKNKAKAETPEGLHDLIKSKISHGDYMHHVRIAKFATNKIKDGLAEAGHISKNPKSNSGKITAVHWTSRPVDIEKLYGEKDAGNTSDLVVKKRNKRNLVVETDNGPHHGGDYIGLSLKIHNEPKTSTLANPGRGSMDAQFLSHEHNTNTDHFEKSAIAAAHKAAAIHGIDTTIMSKKKAHDTIKRNGNITNIYKDHAKKQLDNIASTYKTALRKRNPHHLANTLRKIANVKPTKMKMYKSATYGTNNLTHSFHNPAVEFESILDQHQGHIKVGESKGTTIRFVGKDNTPLGHLSIKYGSSTPHTGVVGSLQGWSAAARNSVSKETHSKISKKMGYSE